VDAILRDIARMGVKPDVVSYTSDYFDFLQQRAEQLLRDGLAFIDTSTKQEVRIISNMHVFYWVLPLPTALYFYTCIPATSTSIPVYLCTSDRAAQINEQRKNCKPSPCRDQSVEKNLELWEEMKKGTLLVLFFAFFSRSLLSSSESKSLSPCFLC
jgi:hypothetical protein